MVPGAEGGCTRRCAKKVSGAGKKSKPGLLAWSAVAILGAAALSGCAGLDNTSNAAPKPLAAVQISPSAVTFPTAPVGQQVTQTATLTNTSESAVSVTQLEASSPEFTTSGLALPVNLGPGQSTMFRIAYRGTSTGTFSGTLTAMTAHGGGSGKIKLTGASGKTSSQLSLSATTLKYGNVLLNGSSTQAVTLKNSGQGDLTISQLSVAGAGFSVSGFAVPTTIPAGQSVAMQATFAPTTVGTATGSVSITSDATTPTASVALSGTGMAASYTMSLAPSAVNLGNVNVGATASQTIALSNSGNASVTITQVSATGSGVSVSGISAPVTVNPSQSIALTVAYHPTAPGTTTGSVTVTNSDGVNTVAAVTANAVQGALSVSPASASFGAVLIGSSSAAQQIQLKNPGTANLTINSATISGSGFTASGLTFPLTLTPGQSAALNVQYAPNTSGASTGAISFSSTAPNSPAAVALSGTGVTASYTMALSPASVAFGNIHTGSTAAQTVTLTNTGSSSISISTLSASGAGVSVSGLSAGASLAPSQSVPLSVTFSPTASGAVTGSLSVSNSQGVNASASITGAGVQAGLSVTPASAAFGNVVTGNVNSQTIQLTNTGTATLTVSQATVSGSGFSIGSLSVPLNIAPSQSASFNVQYAPATAGGATGSLSILSNASSAPATVALSGTGVAATTTLSVNPASLSFGSVNDGTTASQSFTFTNTGNSSVAVSGVSVIGTGYSILTGSGAVTLSPNQSASVSVQFAPIAAGSSTGTVTIASNASGSPSVSLSGTGAAQVSHSVGLSWGASASTVAGYNVYRSTVSGSSYSRVNGSLVSNLSFSDATVSSGQTYYYVATAVDSSGTESPYSNEVSSTVP